MGVFTEVFKVASAQGRALDVDRRPQRDGNLLVLAGIAYCLTDRPRGLRIKRCREGAGCREADSLDAVINAQMVPIIPLLAQAMRTV